MSTQNSIQTPQTATSTHKGCSIKVLPQHQWIPAAAKAIARNPANAPDVQMLHQATNAIIKPDHLALLTSKYWGVGGVSLTVSFLDNPEAELRTRILGHMNAWAAFANVKFTEVAAGGQVRISRTPGDGYWSYLGTDILSIPADEPTMNLESFSMTTPDSEFYRVIRHETGHTLGFPHEHMRKQIVDRIDPDKAIAHFQASDGWSPDQVRAQVLTPLDDATIVATAAADTVSIMCYWLPAEIMKDNIAVPGGLDIDVSDEQFANRVYPKVH